MQHMFLNTEIIDGEIEMQRRGHADRRHVARPMGTGLHVIESGEIGSLLHGGNPAAMHNAHAQVIDELLAHQLFCVPNAVEHLAHGQRGRGVLADEPESVLQLGRHRIFHPEKMKRLKLLAQTRCLDGSQPMVNIMQQVQIIAKGVAQRLKKLGNMAQIFFRGP